MDAKAIAQAYWRAIDMGDWRALEALFMPGADILWPNTQERFVSPGLFAQANEAYPGVWRARLESVELMEPGAVSVAQVFEEGGEHRFYAISFFVVKEGKIAQLIEYWSGIDEVPAWRRAYSEPMA